MSTNLTKIKNLFNAKGLARGVSDQNASDPQIGFKISHCEYLKSLRVKIIGARHLPTVYGSVKPAGYLVKVTVFPGKQKFETCVAKESWPNFNQEFDFDLHTGRAPISEALSGKFISFTAYAILDSPTESKTKTLKRSFRIFSEKKPELSRGGTRVSRRVSVNNRRTIGVATYNLDAKSFTQQLKTDYVATPDIWRKLEQISSGIQHATKESKKGSLEVTMCYSVSEDGANDTIEVGLSKLRCSMQTMEQHEKMGSNLYIKIAAFEYDCRIAKLKSDKFQPTISLRIEPNTATLLARVNRDNLDRVEVVISLMCKNILGKKHKLGEIRIQEGCDIWKEAIEAPSNPVTKMIDLV